MILSFKQCKSLTLKKCKSPGVGGGLRGSCPGLDLGGP